MQLQKIAVEDRSFLIQFGKMIEEFGDHIPWLNKIKNLKYITNVSEFRPEILQTLALDPATKIDPYILTADTKGREYAGSFLRFSSSPEHFKDANNTLIQQQLEQGNYSYLSCFQINKQFSAGKPGLELLSQSLITILEESAVWFVAPTAEHVRYYQKLGAQLINTVSNEDGLYIMAGDEKSFAKRH